MTVPIPSSPLVIGNRPVPGPDRRAFMASPETLVVPRPAPLPEQPSEPIADSSPDAVLPGAHAETGTVKWFSVAKKYGFITPDAGGKDVFVHMSALQKSAITSLEDGARVSYELTQEEGRPSAGVVLVLQPESDG